MPYEYYNPYENRRFAPYENRRFAPYRNEGQSLLNFSQFQPTFIGQPIQEMGQAYKAYRDTADMILDTGDALGQVLASANVDPKDRPMLAQKKLELDGMLKDVAATGDFAPARVKMRNVVNKVKMDQFIPAAENRYAMKLKAIADVNEKAGKLEIGPQLQDIYLKDIESSFSPTIPDNNGLYTKEFIPREIGNEFKFHEFLREFMNDKKLSWKSLGYEPVYKEIRINPDDPNSPTKTVLAAWLHGITGDLKPNDLAPQAEEALKSSDFAKASIRDLTRYSNEIEGIPITEDELIKQIVRPYAENFAYSDVRPAYDAARDYDQQNPIGLSGGPYPPVIATVPGIMVSEKPYEFGKMESYPGDTPTASYYTNPGDEERTSSPKYNPGALTDKEREIVFKALKDYYGVTPDDYKNNYNTRRVQDALSGVYKVVGNLTGGSKILNNKAVEYVPGAKYLGENTNKDMDDSGYLTWKYFGIKPGEAGKQPTLGLSLKNRAIFNLSDNEEITPDELNELLSYVDKSGYRRYPAIRTTHRLTPENMLPFVTGNYAFNNADIVQIGDKTIAIGADPSEIRQEDILLNKISTTGLFNGRLIQLPEFYNSNIITQQAGANLDGSPIISYTTNLDDKAKGELITDVQSQILTDARTRIEYDRLKSIYPSLSYGELINEARKTAKANSSSTPTKKEQELITDYYTNNPSYTSIIGTGNLNSFSASDMLNSMKSVNPEIYFFTKTY